MGKGTEGKIFYFDQKGAVNTDKALDIALGCCAERKVQRIVVASSSGKTALSLSEKAGPSIEIIAVTYCAGSKYAEEVQAFNKNQPLLLERGIRIVRGLHALSGVERTFENRYKSGFTPLNVVADTLRIFSQGIKVCVEVAIMAAEHGFVTPDEEVVVVAGSGHGADTAVVMKPAYAMNLFDIKIRALLCMPSG
jgi:uncharacterized protein